MAVARGGRGPNVHHLVGNMPTLYSMLGPLSVCACVEVCVGVYIGVFVLWQPRPLPISSMQGS